jgi:alpha-mannosidase
MEIVASHIEHPMFENQNYMLAVLNTTENAQNGPVKFTVDILSGDNIDAFEIYDANNQKTNFKVLSKKRTVVDVFSPINLPGTLDIDRYEIYIDAQTIESFSARGYALVPKNGADMPAVKQIKSEKIVLENEYIRVNVDENGRVDITDKVGGLTLKDAVDFEDTGDSGDSYVYVKTGAPAIYASGFPAVTEFLVNNEFEQSCVITRVMSIPAEYDFETADRSAETINCTIRFMLTLKKSSETLETSYIIDNQAKDHRLRFMFKTGIDNEYTFADSPFDTVRHSEADHFPETMAKVHANTSFAQLGNVNVFTEGQHEYEHIRENGALLFTVLRATGMISRAMTGAVQSELWYLKDNQCIRELSGRFGIKFNSKNPALDAKVFRNPVITHAISCDRRKFAGGRPCVQDTALQEFFYLPDEYAGLKIPDNIPVIEFNGENTVITALKRAEENIDIVLRFCNMSEELQMAELKTGKPVYSSDMTETRGNKTSETLPVSPKQILTVVIDNNINVHKNV